MEYTEKELEKYNRKAPLVDIVKEIENSGISIDYNKYPDYKGLKVLRQIILDYQDLVPGEEPDLTEMTEAVDEIDIDFEDPLMGGIEPTEKEVKEFFNEDVKPVEKPKKKREADLSLVKKYTDDATKAGGAKTEEGRRLLVYALYEELLFRKPDSGGMVTYTNCILDGMSISNIRDAIKRSKEYKKKHGLM